MKRGSVIMKTWGAKEYAAGERCGAQERFLRYLRTTTRILQKIVDSNLRTSNCHALPSPH